MKKIPFLICFILALAVIAAVIVYTSEKNDNTINISEPKAAEEKLIDVPAISQYPEMPTGCEAAAAAMVLQYYGVDISAESFANCWLVCNESFYYSSNELYGPDPNEVFVGNPFSANSYGCYASVIVKAINNNSSDCKAQKIIDKNLKTLCEEYIDNNKPLLIWATIGMKESKAGKEWNITGGNKFTWISGEHCLVLTGYYKDYYFFNDPTSGSTVAYQKAIAEKRFAELGKQAVYISKAENIEFSIP